MWSEQTWLLIVPTWIAIVACGVIFAVIEKRNREKK